MRVLLFLDTDHLSGPARLALDFAVEGRRRGHEIEVLGLTRGNATANAFTAACAEAGFPSRLLRERFRFDPGIVRQFEAILNEFQPAIYQSHGYKGSLLGLRARRRGIRWQAVFHGFTWENWKVRLYHRLDVRWLRRADEVVVVSRDFGRRLAASGVNAARLRWIPNAIDEANLRASDSGVDLRQQWLHARDSGAVLVGVIGRLSPEKAPVLFLQAFAGAAQREPQLHAVLVGDGPLMENCRHFVAAEGLSRRITLAGFREDVAAIYRALDMLVIPSRSEGMPTVLIEAMLMHVPVISTRVGAVPEIMSDGENALLVPIGEAGALAAAIERLARDSDLRFQLADRAGRLARERLTVGARAETLLHHMECLIQGQSLPPDDQPFAQQESVTRHA